MRLRPRPGARARRPARARRLQPRRGPLQGRVGRAGLDRHAALGPPAAATATPRPRRRRSTRSPARASCSRRVQPLPADAAVARLALHGPAASARTASATTSASRSTRSTARSRALPATGATRPAEPSRPTCCAAAPASREGFDDYDDALALDAGVEAIGELQRDGAIATEALARFVEAQAGRRFFAFLHLYEPHAPYAPPAAAPPARRSLRRGGGLRRRARRPAAGAGCGALALYDRALARRDLRSRRGAARPRRAGARLLPLPRGASGAAGAAAARRARGAARVWRASSAHVDLAATLLDLAGPAGRRDGRRLAAPGDRERPRQRRGRSTRRRYYPRYHFGWSELLAATEDRYRYIRAPRSELYDRARDPGERQDLAASARRGGARDARLARAEGTRFGVSAAGGRLERSQRGARRARVRRAAALSLRRPQPSRCPTRRTSCPSSRPTVRPWRRVSRAGSTKRSRGCARWWQDSPGLLDAWQALGTSYARLGREREAIAAFEAILRQDATNAEAHIALARIHELAGRRDRAEKHARLASEKEPARGFETLAEIQLDLRRPAEAAESARRSLDADPGRVMSRFVLAKVESRPVATKRPRASTARRSSSRAVSGGSSCAVCTRASPIAWPGWGVRRTPRPSSVRRSRSSPTRARPAWGSGCCCALRAATPRRARCSPASSRANPRAGADEYFVVASTLATLGDVDAARDWARRGRALFPGDPRLR